MKVSSESFVTVFSSFSKKIAVMSRNSPSSISRKSVKSSGRFSYPEAARSSCAVLRSRMAVLPSGKRLLSTLRAACWWCRNLADVLVALKVSSKNATPTPSAPPISLSIPGVHGLFLMSCANRANRTGTILLFTARLSMASLRNCF